MEYTKTLLKKLSTIKEEIPKSFTYSASLKVIHCPYCAHQALYGIIIDKHREIIIRYRCSKSASVNLATVTAATSPFSLKMGPPELPGFTGASICT